MTLVYGQEEEEMKPIEEVARVNKEYGWLEVGGYHKIVESMGYEIVLWEDDSDYQGDSYYLLKDGDKVGYLVFGWGSCSGCDALQACSSVADVGELRSDLHNSIRWFDGKGKLREYMSNKDWETEWYWHSSSEAREFIKRMGEYVGMEEGTQ